MATLDDSVLQAVSNTNFKALAEGPAQIYFMQLQNATSHQNRLHLIAESNVGKICETMNTLDPVEAAGVNSLNNSLQGSVVAALQQIMKGAQTTPPLTTAPPVTS